MNFIPKGVLNVKFTGLRSATFTSLSRGRVFVFVTITTRRGRNSQKLSRLSFVQVWSCAADATCRIDEVLESHIFLEAQAKPSYSSMCALYLPSPTLAVQFLVKSKLGSMGF